MKAAPCASFTRLAFKGGETAERAAYLYCQEIGRLLKENDRLKQTQTLVELI